MGKLLKLVFWIALIYAAVVYGWPWLQDTIEGIGEETASTAKSLSAGPEGRCIDLAAQTADRFGQGMRGFSSPPYDPAAWDEFQTSIRDKISYAQAECGCGEEACRYANDALGELNSMLADFGRMIRGNSQTMIDPGRDMERVYDLLDQARATMP